MIPDGPRALLLNGTVGVGKSTVAETIAGLLSSRDVPNAYLDMDGLRHKWPAPADDPFNSALATTNLSSLAANFVRAGIERLVLAGVIETESELAAYSSAVGMPLVTSASGSVTTFSPRGFCRDTPTRRNSTGTSLAPRNSIRSWIRQPWMTTPSTSRHLPSPTRHMRC